ncbi:MAG: hypothetical protein JKY09_05500 [Crocinitomicaceae bacterium]|nr:hypothetical protein [Crocinitomicaceae bacterium]
MDFEDNRLAGKLGSAGGVRNVQYIGPYSRFTFYEQPKDKSIPNVLILSGPTVYAQQLLNQVTKDWPKNEELTIIGSDELDFPSGYSTIVGNWKIQDQTIMKAKRIISRSGYSTIMDLEVLKIDATLIPTHGQAEQEYLSKLHGIANRDKKKLYVRYS